MLQLGVSSSVADMWYVLLFESRGYAAAAMRNVFVFLTGASANDLTCGPSGRWDRSMDSSNGEKYERQ